MQESWVVGINAVQGALEANPEQAEELLVAESRHPGRIAPLLNSARAAGVLVTRVAREDLDRRFADERHQGVALRFQPPALLDEGDLDDLVAPASTLLLLILDQVQDPRNLGACLRSAAAAGVDAVVFPRDRAASITPAARKAAAGAAERLPLVQVTNLATVLKKLKDAGVWLVGADGTADQTLWQVDLKGRIGIVMGSEGKGLRRLTREHCDFLARIPMRADAESLNVSVAASIFLFEAMRQRNA